MSNLFGQFKIYPRGFLGAKLDPILVQKQPNTTRLTYDVSVFDANQPELVTANQDVEEAYASLVRKDILSGDFNFQEQTLRKILKAFGTMDFEAWYMAQYQSPSFGPMQQDFLEDCLHFMCHGTRQLGLTSWDVLLESSNTRLTAHKLPTMAAAHFNKVLVSDLAASGDRPLTDTIQSWMSKPNGFTDLLFSAHILFGFKQ